METDVDEGQQQIVLHEEKRYYPSAEEVYPGAVTVVLDEDAQPLEEPLLKPNRVRIFSHLEKTVPRKSYSTQFMIGLMEQPDLIRNISIVGSLHSGKTLFMDCLVEACHEAPRSEKKNQTEIPIEVKYCDTRHDEHERELSIKSSPLCVVIPDLRGKHWLINAVDCPGHVNFFDEASVCVAACDGCVLVVDALEGLNRAGEHCIQRALNSRVALTLVLNKIDRLILELKLPPVDAYFKLCHVLEEVNAAIEDAWAKVPHRYDSNDCVEPPLLDPRNFNVAFASGLHGWCFTLESLALIYLDHAKYQRGSNKKMSTKGIEASAKDLGRRLWGDLYFDDRTRRFMSKPPQREQMEEESSDPRRSFVQFALEPLYKVYAQVLGEEPETLKRSLRELDVHLTQNELRLDPKPLLKVAMTKFFKQRTAASFAQLVSRHSPSPRSHAKHKLAHYAGDMSDEYAKATLECDPNAPLLIHVVKLYSTADASNFMALGRVYAGTVHSGQQVDVLGETYSSEDPEDARTCVVTNIAAPHGRHATELQSAGPGNLVLLSGLDDGITKTATIVDAPLYRRVEPAVFRCPRRAICELAVLKLAVEPLNPAELPKMTDGLRKIAKSYPAASTKVEASGEHVILGTGELYLDCIMRDLREMYSQIEIKVADPVVSFCETVSETSSLKCFSETPNKRNKLSLIAEPLDQGMAEALDAGAIDPNWSSKQLGNYVQNNYKWDLLAARSIWAFGPDPLDSRTTGSLSSNILLDDTLPSEVDKNLLCFAKDAIVQGFQWSCREGPLCDEPMRNCKFKILDAAIADQPLHRGSGQIIPTSRRVCYSAFLMAAPRLMEPILAVEVQCPADCVSAVYPVLARRRGHVVHDSPKPGAPFYTVHAFLPAIDSFGFETDLRAYTSGQAMCTQTFDHWAICPGDPLDRSIILHPLEPSPPPHLAREFMVKTRRRKGLSEDTSIAKYFDDPLLRELASQEAASSSMHIIDEGD
uniref:Tr-type G domain-containing protein n=1 Tax=Aureoumbra lagunensis TaxID=44058 RepID=A0A7S3NFY3_9STRA